MAVWKLVSGILSIVLCVFVLLQSAAAGLLSRLPEFSGIGDIPLFSWLIVAALLLVGGVIAIVTRDALSGLWNAALILFYGVAALAGCFLPGGNPDLVFVAAWCLLCAAAAAIALAADNVCDFWVYIVIAVLSAAIAAGGFLLNRDAIQERLQKPGALVPGGQELPESGSQDAQTAGSGEEAGDAEPLRADAPAGGDLSTFYDVEIKEARRTEDYYGNPAVVITYEWTNNSDETVSADAALTARAFQDGVQLDRAVIENQGLFDASTSSKNIRPGTTFDVQCAFVLTSETAVIEFEIAEWLSSSDSTVATTFDPANL